jgi:hypothetical protein
LRNELKANSVYYNKMVKTLLNSTRDRNALEQIIENVAAQEVQGPSFLGYHYFPFEKQVEEGGTSDEEPGDEGSGVGEPSGGGPDNEGPSGGEPDNEGPNGRGPDDGRLSGRGPSNEKLSTPQLSEGDG